MIGQRIDRYEIVAKLGEGGMGAVWRARDTVLGRHVALKLLPHGTTQSDEATKRLFREAQTASRLDHPSIATVHDVGQVDAQLFVTFALVDGETVSDRCASGPLEVELALRLAHQGAEALAHAHEQGVLHRDVTGRNAMINRAGRLVLVDFGLARAQDHTRTTLGAAPLGTASYVAPEVAKGGVADERSDVYGLGVVLYEMLTGTLPFRGERLEALLYAAAHEEPDPPSARRTDLPPAIDALVAKALAKDPRERFQTAAEFASAVEATLTGSVSVAAYPSRRRSRLSISRPALWGGITVVGVLAGITVWSFLRGHSTPSARYSSAAVLPLQVRGDAQEESRRLADGICESMASKLTQITDLRMAPWITSSRYSAEAQDLSEIAQELNVDTLIIGAFERSGSTIRGYLDLVEARSGLKVSTHEFEEPFSNVMDLQRTLVLDLAKSLKGRLTGAERSELDVPVTRSPEAFDLYLKGGAQLQMDTRSAASLAIDYFEKALDLDPNLAEAHLGLGAVHHQRVWRSWEGGLRSLELAEQHFSRALELNPDLMPARHGLLLVWAGSGRYEKCLELGKSLGSSTRHDVETLLVRAMAYHFGGLPSLGIPLFRQALERDPANQGALFYLVNAYYWAGRFEDAVEAGSAYLRRFPDESEIRLWIASSQHRLGRLRWARNQYEQALKLAGNDPNPDQYRPMAHLFFDLGDTSRALEVLRQGIQHYEDRLRRFPETTTFVLDNLATLHAMLGDREETERYLVAFQDRNPRAFTTVWTTYCYLGDAERDQQFYRRFVLTLEPSEMHRALISPQPTRFGQIACLEPLLPELERELTKLTEKYRGEDSKPSPLASERR